MESFSQLQHLEYGETTKSHGWPSLLPLNLQSNKNIKCKNQLSCWKFLILIENNRRHQDQLFSLCYLLLLYHGGHWTWKNYVLLLVAFLLYSVQFKFVKQYNSICSLYITHTHYGVFQFDILHINFLLVWTTLAFWPQFVLFLYFLLNSSDKRT